MLAQVLGVSDAAPDGTRSRAAKSVRALSEEQRQLAIRTKARSSVGAMTRYQEDLEDR